MSPAGTAAIPALAMNRSRRGVRVRISLADSGVDERDARSREMNVILMEGCLVFRSEIKASARVLERPVKMIWEGAWAAMARMVCSPRPAVPGEVVVWL